MASREAMNMGSRSSSVISELKSVISLLGQTTDSAFQKITSGVSKVSSVGGQVSNVSSTLVAPNPVFNAPAITYMTETGNGIVASSPNTPVVSGGGFGGNQNLTNYVAQHGGGTLYAPESGSGGGGFGRGGGGTGGAAGDPNSTSRTAGALGKAGNIIAGVFAGYNTIADMMPSTSDVLEAQLLQQRASFYTGGGKAGIGAITASQRELANLATLSGDNPQMDVLRAQIAAQSYGLAGPNTNKILTSAANVSNLMPGIGVEGAVRATGAMQQAYSVNMLRGIGIQLRGPNGTMQGPDEVIEAIWAKICRDYGQAYGSGKTPPLREVQIALQPGNSLDSMLNQYFGSDPMLKQLVANGLLYKAQSGGAINKAGVENLGGTTESILSFTKTAATGQGMLTSGNVVSGATTGFESANKYIQTYYNSLAESANPLGGGLMALKSSIDTLLTAFNGNLFALLGSAIPTVVGGFASFLKNALPPEGKGVSDILSGLLTAPGQFLTGLTGLASGGPVSDSTPYIVGEKGPELFVPDSDGTIIPNNKLGTGSTYNYSFTINAASGDTKDLVKEIKNVLIQIETNKKVSES